MEYPLTTFGELQAAVLASTAQFRVLAELQGFI